MAILEFPQQHRIHPLEPLAGWPSVARTGLYWRLAQAWQNFQTERARRKTVRMLEQLDTRTLRDLDITPREIESLVYGEGHDRTRHYDRFWWRKAN